MKNFEKDGRQNKIGICMKLGEIKAFEKLDADYLELPFAQVTALSVEESEELRAYLTCRKIECPVMTQLLPKKARIVDDDCAFHQYESFLKEGFFRVQKLNTKMIVLGNAGARNCFDGDTEAAIRRLTRFCSEVSELALEFGITICLEPLNRIQSNVINTLAEAIDVVKEVNMPNFGIVWDYFHYQVEKDDAKILEDHVEALKHCHTADILHRGVPQLKNQKKLIEFLKNVEYKGKISLEFDKLPHETGCINKVISELRRSLE